MEIILKKETLSTHRLTIIKDGEIFEQVSLDTKTYFLHDIVHYCVEQELGLIEGFWGMIAQGYRIEQITGKNNELSTELRRVEKIVGPVQSVYSGHMSAAMFRENMKLIDLAPDAGFIEIVTSKITAIMDKWKYLSPGESLKISFAL